MIFLTFSDPQPSVYLSDIRFEFSLFISQEATRLSLVSGDQASYARSIRIMGDIYRKKSDINVSTGKMYEKRKNELLLPRKQTE